MNNPTLLKALLVLLLLGFCCAHAFAQEADYVPYHESINAAEEAFFLAEDCGAALQRYREAFSEYSYVFARDAINAVQVAEYCGEDALPFFLRGVDSGLSMQHLKDVPVLQRLYSTVAADTAIIGAYEARRRGYLDRIDYTYLLRMYDRMIEDQVKKNHSDFKYSSFQMKLRDQIQADTRERGFPGAKHLGIDNSSIFEEAIGKKEFDLDQRKRKKYGDNLNHLILQDSSLSSKPIILILIHDHCIIREWEWEPFLKDAMRKGEIHPREIALIYDNQFGSHKGCLKDDEPDYPYFKLHLFVNYRTLTERTNAEINEFRSAWHLVPLEVDEAKKRYEENLGFSLTRGFWGCL